MGDAILGGPPVALPLHPRPAAKRRCPRPGWAAAYLEMACAALRRRQPRPTLENVTFERPLLIPAADRASPPLRVTCEVDAALGVAVASGPPSHRVVHMRATATGPCGAEVSLDWAAAMERCPRPLEVGDLYARLGSPPLLLWWWFFGLAPVSS